MTNEVADSTTSFAFSKADMMSCSEIETVNDQWVCLGDVIWKDFIDVFVETVCVLGEGRMRAQVTRSSDTKTEESL